MGIYISAPTLYLFGFSLFLFTLVTIWLWQMSMFDDDSLGIGGMFCMIFYSALWACPTLLAWAIYATWFKGALHG